MKGANAHHDDHARCFTAFSMTETVPSSRKSGRTCSRVPLVVTP